MKISNIKLGSYVFIALFAMAVSCKKDDDNNNSIPEGKNKMMIQDITYANNAEVDLGTLANSKGNSATVKSFGLMMIQDHQKAQNDLDTIAIHRNITLPTGLKQDKQTLKNTLSGYSGHSFDTAYINSQVKMHNDTKNMLVAFLDTSTDQNLKNYVNRTLSTVLIHLVKADSIAKAIK